MKIVGVSTILPSSRDSSVASEGNSTSSCFLKMCTMILDMRMVQTIQSAFLSTWSRCSMIDLINQTDILTSKLITASILNNWTQDFAYERGIARYFFVKFSPWLTCLPTIPIPIHSRPFGNFGGNSVRRTQSQKVTTRLAWWR